MIYLVTCRPEYYNWNSLENDEIVRGHFDEFVHWASKQKSLQLDTETTMVDDGPNSHQDRELTVIQFGTKDQEVQWVIDFIGIEHHWFHAIRDLLASDCFFIAHNARFEYIVLQVAFNVKIENLHDTYLMSRILNTGLELPPGYHSLKKCLERFFGLEMSKEEQTSFDGTPLSYDQIMYAALDVVMLHELAGLLANELQKRNLWYLYNSVEREVMKVYGDMELTPMRFDKDYWSQLAQTFINDKNDITKKLNQEVLNDPALVKTLKNSSMVLKNDLVQPYDELKIKWNSTTQKKAIFGLLFPFLPDTVKTKPQLKKWVKDNEDTLDPEDLGRLNLYMNRDYDKLNTYLMTNHKQWLIENGFYVTEGTVQINWSSPQQKLYIFQHYYPNMKDTNAGTLAKIYKNPLINVFKDFTKADKRVSSYGEGFVDRYVRRDGMIAPFKPNQILNTGRISFGILLQMPGEAKFRNAFYPPEDDWVFIDTDYSSQEIVVMAYAAGEESLLQAIRDGKDAHSLVAQMMFPEKWAELAEPDCIQMKNGHACECPGHKKFRKKAKALNFGIPYGMSAIGLADRLDCDKKEAQEMMNLYFTTFPALKKMFEDNEKFGIEQHYIKGIGPTHRIRFFHPPENGGDRGSIGRASKNFPIQEGGASITKMAQVLLRKRIIEENLPMRLHLPVHDEILSSCPRWFAEKAKQIQEKAMTDAADMFLEPGLLGVESVILDRWTK